MARLRQAETAIDKPEELLYNRSGKRSTMSARGTFQRAKVHNDSALTQQTVRITN